MRTAVQQARVAELHVQYDQRPAREMKVRWELARWQASTTNDQFWADLIGPSRSPSRTRWWVPSVALLVAVGFAVGGHWAEAVLAMILCAALAFATRRQGSPECPLYGWAGGLGDGCVALFEQTNTLLDAGHPDAVALSHALATAGRRVGGVDVGTIRADVAAVMGEPESVIPGGQPRSSLT